MVTNASEWLRRRQTVTFFAAILPVLTTVSLTGIFSPDGVVAASSFCTVRSGCVKV